MPPQRVQEQIVVQVLSPMNYYRMLDLREVLLYVQSSCYIIRVSYVPVRTIVKAGLQHADPSTDGREGTPYTKNSILSL